MNTKASNTSKIHGEKRLEFQNAGELRAYYETKYAEGGYSDGVVVRGLSVSRIYHAARFDSAMGFVSKLPPGDTLDVGCGDGAFALRLASHAKSVTAVDIAANAFTSAAQTNPSIKFSQMDAEELRFPAGAFDVATCIETLEHVLNPNQALSEMCRVLKKGGHLALSYPLINMTTAKRLHLAPRLSISEHLNEWSYPELLLNIKMAGFYVEEVDGLVFDFGYLNAIKMLGRGPASWLTKLSLSIRGNPENSMFVVLLLKKA